jgi:hypothetical protein
LLALMIDGIKKQIMWSMGTIKNMYADVDLPHLFMYFMHFQFCCTFSQLSQYSAYCISCLRKTQLNAIASPIWKSLIKGGTQTPGYLQWNLILHGLLIFFNVSIVQKTLCSSFYFTISIQHYMRTWNGCLRVLSEQKHMKDW